jgi:hypothetical protein
MRRLLTKVILRRSPRRLDPPLRPDELHATLTPIEEEGDAGKESDPSTVLFGPNSPIPAVVVEEPTAAAAAEAAEASEAAEMAPSVGVSTAATTATAESPPPTKLPAQPMPSPEIRALPNFKRLEARFQDGYDSDGLPAPVYDMEAEEFDEEAVVLAPVDEGTTTAASVPSVPSEPHFIFLSAADIDKLTIPRLKHELMIRGVQYASTLKKPALKERLILAMENKVMVTVFGEQSKKTKGGKKAAVIDMTGFAPGSHWVPLLPDKEAVVEPVNTLANARAPTVPRDEAFTVPIKHNFNETFDRPLFQGRHFVPRYDDEGNKVTDAAAAQNIVIRKHLVARRKFQIKHQLSKHSDPVEFAEAFIPWNANVYNDKFLSMHQLTVFTNLKALSANAGKGGSCYPDFEPFTVKQIRQFLGVSIWQGLNPSPRVEMKFASSFEDPVQGNQYLYHHIGRNAVRRYKEYRAFFRTRERTLLQGKPIPYLKFRRW